MHLICSRPQRPAEAQATVRSPPTFVFVSTMSVIPQASVAVQSGWTGSAGKPAKRELKHYPRYDCPNLTRSCDFCMLATRGLVDTLLPAACAAALESGYAQSKLVAEHHLAATAMEGSIDLVIARLGLIGDPAVQPTPSEATPGEGTRGTHPTSVQAADTPVRWGNRRDWLSLLLCAVEATGASPAGLTAGGKRVVAVLPVDKAAGSLASHASRTAAAALAGVCDGVATPRVKICHLDAAAFGLKPLPLAQLLDEVEIARGPDAKPLRREVPYPMWRGLVATAGPPAMLALAMLPPEAAGGALRLPSGARRRIRDRGRLSAEAVLAQSD